MDESGFRFRQQPSGSGPTVQRILATLPSWFGIPSSVDDYVAVADRSPTVIATLDDDVGFLTTVLHSPHAAEIYVMGIDPHYHRQGIGRQMLALAESALVVEGVEYLQVKTLSSTQPDDGYAKTRAFYLANGFRELEELPTLWDANNPALQDGEAALTIKRPENGGPDSPPPVRWLQASALRSGDPHLCRIRRRGL
ncbi:MAG: GNAT family N-acetyltransferase [Acidimicrobiales bacterium]